MIRHASVSHSLGRHAQPTRVDQLLDELAVVDYLERAAELRVLVFERVEAVWAAGHHPLRLILIQALDIGLRQDLVQVFVASSAGRVAAAALLLAEDGELHAGRGEDLRQGCRDALVARVERRHAANPVDDLQLARVSHARELLDTRGACPVSA